LFKLVGEFVHLGIDLDLFLAAEFGKLGGFFGFFPGLFRFGGLLVLIAGGGVGEGFRGLGLFRSSRHVRGGDDVGELAQRLGGESVLDIFPVGLDLLVGGLDRGLIRINRETSQAAGDTLVFERQVAGDDVAVHAEPGADDGVDFLRGEGIGRQLAEVGLRHAEAADSFFDEIPVGCFIKLAIGTGEGAQAADVVRDFLFAGMHTEVLLGLAQQDAADEKFLRGIVLAGGPAGEAHHELIEPEITGAGEAGGEGTAAKVSELLVAVDAAVDFEDSLPTHPSAEEVILDADDEGKDDEGHEEDDEAGVFADVFDHERRAEGSANAGELREPAAVLQW